MSSQVFETYELLEDILLRLPLRQLLLAQKVNKKFHTLVHDSPRIKRALFLEPTAKSFVVREREFIPGTPNARTWPSKLGTYRPVWKLEGAAERPAVIINPFTQM